MIMSDSLRLIEGLRQAQAWDHPVSESIDLVETHISWIVLTGPFAYKFHKPVNLGFLDFTTLEQRLWDCQEELRLNRRLSSDLYIDLVAVLGTPECPRVVAVPEDDPHGLDSHFLPVIEYGLRMRQFSQQALLPAALRRGDIHNRQIDDLAITLARFHAGASRAPVDGPYGTAAAILQPVLANFDVLVPRLTPDLVLRMEQLKRWAQVHFQKIKPLFQQRLATGHVRECHGDLHLGNMVLHDGRIQVFDCLEFSASLRWIDVISDLAFLVMDLEERGYPRQANRILNRWLEQSGDYAGLRLWRWYVSYRALVRAKVAVLSGDQSADCGVEAYCSVAERQMVAETPNGPTQCSLLFCHGVSGSGKSHLAIQVAGAIGAILLRSDVERKRWFGLWGIPSEPHRQGDPYTTAVTEELFQHHLPGLAAQLLAWNFSIIVDATYGQYRHRQAMVAVAARAGVPCLILDLRTPLHLLQQRIRQRQRVGGNASDADLAVLQRQLDRQQPLSRQERARAISIEPGWTLSAVHSAIADRLADVHG